MRKMRLSILGAVIGALLLAACGAGLPGAASASVPAGGMAQSGQQSSGGPNFANMSLEEKLSIGTLKLEGTDKAITADQAKTLLPLWKAVKSLGSSTAASPQETSALYQQIEDAMTAEQVQAIKDMILSSTDMQALMKQYNVQAPQGGPNNAMQATQAAKSGSGSTSSGNAASPGASAAGGGLGSDMGGGMPPDGGLGMPPGSDMGAAPSDGQPNAQGTPQAGQRSARPGMNLMFVDPVIQVLEQRASS